VAERLHLVVVEDVVLQKFQTDYFQDVIAVDEERSVCQMDYFQVVIAMVALVADEEEWDLEQMEYLWDALEALEEVALRAQEFQRHQQVELQHFLLPALSLQQLS